MVNKSLNNFNILILILISISFFAGKWITSFISFSNEDIVYKLISESHEDSAMYFHYVKKLINLDFNNNFSQEINSSGHIIIPIGSVLFHAMGLKLFGIQSFIFLEFAAIFFFLLIFFLIFKQFKFSDNISLALSSLMFVLPLIFSWINVLNIIEINTFSKNFYNLRFPRPLVAQLYFFSFIYILIVSLNKNFFEKKYLFSLSIIASLSFSSFFFIFINQIICLIIFLYIRYKKNLFDVIKSNFRKILLSLFLFILISLPFIVLIVYSNIDYNERLGINNLDFEDKVFLIKHYFEKLTRFKSLSLYLLIFIIYFTYKKYLNENIGIINTFLAVFISSLLSPIIFIAFSNKVSFLYHFNNIVIISIILLIVIFIVAFLSKIFLKYQYNKFYNYFSILIIFILIALYNSNFFFKNNKMAQENKNRYEKNEIINLINKNNNLDLKKISMLTFDTEIMTWAILNDIKNLKIIDGTYSTKSNNLIEKDLIETFKFLNLNKEDFKNFISNKKKGYRYLNPDMRQLFWQRYQANSLFTYNGTDDFDEKTLEFIKKSSPFYVHQFAIPRFEISRLITMFENYNKNENFKPDIILMNLSQKIINNYNFDKNNYCKVFSGDLYNLYFKSNYCK